MAGAIERNHEDEARSHANANANAREADGNEPHSSEPNDNPTESSSSSSSTLRIEESDVLRTRRKFSHTSEAQRLSVLEWLEQPPNFQLLAGGRDLQGKGDSASTSPLPSRVPVVNAEGKKLKKTDGFRSLMRHVNARTQSQWTLDVTRSRFESLLAAFRKTRAIAQRSDFHVTANDRVRGITDTRQKLNALCMCYDRLDALFTTGKPLKAPEAPVPEDIGTTTTTKVAADGAEKRKESGDPDGSKATIIMKHSDQSRGDAAKNGDPQSISRAAVVIAAAAKGVGDKVEDGKADDSADDTQLDQLLEVNDASAAAQAGPKSDTAVDAESAESTASVAVASTLCSPSPSAKRLKVHHQPSSDTESDSSAKSAATAAAAAIAPATSEEENPIIVPVEVASAPAMPSAASTMSHENTVKLKALEVEAQKLALQQEQLQLQKRELALKEKELVAQESMKKQAVRAELTTKLVVAGKSLSEIKEFLALLD